MTPAHRPPVTVIVTHHGDDTSASLPRALESVHLQGARDIEIVVVDDHPDARRHGKRHDQSSPHSPLRVLKTRGIGFARARNMAISAAKGELVAFLDAGDYWLPGKLGPQLQLHRYHPELQFSFTRSQPLPQPPSHRTNEYGFWEAAGEELPRESRYGVISCRTAALLLAHNPVAVSTVVARRAALLAIGGFDDSLGAAAEWDLWLKLSLRGRIGVGTPVSCSCRPNEPADSQQQLHTSRGILTRYQDPIAAHYPVVAQWAGARLSHQMAAIHRHQHHWLKALLWKARAWLQSPYGVAAPLHETLQPPLATTEEEGSRYP